MSKYDISGDEIIISTEVENERFLRNAMEKLIDQAGKAFDDWYANQYDCYSLIDNDNVSEFFNQAAYPLIQKAVEIMNAQGIYSMDENMFLDKYSDGVVDSFYEAVNVIEEKIEKIDGQNRQEQLYRQQRKAGRGRVVGGGFGLGGAIKGMATAGVINATTGVAHSIGNAVGNVGSSISASSSKAAVLKNAKQPLKDALYESLWVLKNNIRQALDKEAGIKCKYVTQTESNTASAILNNYKQNRIPEDRKKEQLIKALQLNPYKLETYYLVWDAYGDDNGDLRRMAAYFEVELENYLGDTAKAYGDDLYSKVCSPYENAWNKVEAGIQLENQIKEAMDNMIRYCNKCEIAEEGIPAINKCNQILQAIDIERRTVKGVIYDTREYADNIRKDYQTFLGVLEGKDIFDDKTYEYVETAQYDSDEFVKGLPALFEAERYRRIPEKIYENIAGIVREKINEEYSGGWINIPGFTGSLPEKESLIYTITGMPAEEIGLIFFDRSMNGKTGILITNCNFRIFSKGLLSTDNRAYLVEDIENIQSIANDEYLLRVRGQEPVKFGLKHKNLTAEQQIIIADMMSELVRLINNLNREKRRGLCRILKGVIQCKCGMNLLSGEKMCPSCKRMLLESGEFVETQICPNCNNYIPIGKKFCFLCGYKLIDTQRE